MMMRGKKRSNSISENRGTSIVTLGNRAPEMPLMYPRPLRTSFDRFLYPSRFIQAFHLVHRPSSIFNLTRHAMRTALKGNSVFVRARCPRGVRNRHALRVCASKVRNTGARNSPSRVRPLNTACRTRDCTNDQSADADWRLLPRDEGRQAAVRWRSVGNRPQCRTHRPSCRPLATAS